MLSDIFLKIHGQFAARLTSSLPLPKDSQREYSLSDHSLRLRYPVLKNDSIRHLTLWIFSSHSTIIAC